jgi:hypothetical protein
LRHELRRLREFHRELEREAFWWVRVGLVFVGIPLLVILVTLVILYFTEGPGSENQPVPFGLSFLSY